jgi:tetratricopeptide (TPR) repeat protein
MGQQPKELTPERSPLHRWGYELRELRKARGLSLRELAAMALIDHSHLGRFERAERKADREQARCLDDVLRAGGMLLRRWEDIDYGQAGRGHVANSSTHVANASSGLALDLASEATSGDVGISVPCRLRDGSVIFVTVPRRSFLSGGAGLGTAAVLGIGTPAAASTPPGRSVRRVRAASAYGSTPVEHLRKLRQTLIDADNLLGPQQALPAVQEHIGVIQQLRREANGTDRQQLLELQTQFAEFASWLYQDAGDHRAAQYWLDRALQWSHTVGDGDLICYVMARKSQLAGDMRDLVDVVDLAEAAQRLARPGSRLAAVGRTYEAYGHALRGEATDSERAFDGARNVVEDLGNDPSPWGVWLTPSYIEVHRAQGLEALGRHSQAAESFDTAIQQLPDGYHRDRGVYLARAAVAHAGAGVPELAAVVGMQALAVAEDTGSGRIVNELARLDSALARWGDLAEVADFRSAFDDVIPYQTERTDPS